MAWTVCLHLRAQVRSDACVCRAQVVQNQSVDGRGVCMQMNVYRRQHVACKYTTHLLKIRICQVRLAQAKSDTWSGEVLKL